MSFISFKNLKLFKTASPRPKKNDVPVAQPKEKQVLWRRLFQNPWIFLLIFVFILAYFLSYVPSKSLPKLKEGEIASSDIISPLDLTIEDTETTAKRRAEAEEAVIPVYSFDENAFLNLEEKIDQFFQFGREWLKKAASPANLTDLGKSITENFGFEIDTNVLDSLARVNFSQDIQETLVSLIGKVSSQGIIVSKNLFIRKEPERGLILLRGPGNERLIKVEEILEIR